jgi:hypothetical protein
MQAKLENVTVGSGIGSDIPIIRLLMLGYDSFLLFSLRDIRVAFTGGSTLASKYLHPHVL